MYLDCGSLFTSYLFYMGYPSLETGNTISYSAYVVLGVAAQGFIWGGYCKLWGFNYTDRGKQNYLYN